MVSVDNLMILNDNDINDTVLSLSDTETKALLIKAISKLKEYAKNENYTQRLVREKFDTTSEKVKPSMANLDYEGNNKKEHKKRGRKAGDTNYYTELARQIAAGKAKDGTIDGIPYEEVIIEGDNKCPICGDDLVEIGEDLMFKVVYKPGSYKLVLYRKKKMACKNNCNELYVPFVDDPLAKTNISTSFIANVINNKFQFGVPAYRLMDDLSNSKISLDYKQIMHHMMKVGLKLKPLADRIQNYAFLNDSLIHIDETTFKLVDPDLKEDGTPRKSNYIFGMVSSKTISYNFTGSREVEWLKELIKDSNFSGCIVTDDYGGYKFIDNSPNIKHQLCLCHARRKMFYAYLAAPEDIRETDNCMARKGLLLFREIFQEERKIKECSEDEKTKYRASKEYRTKVNALKTFCQTTIPMQGTYLEQAINYTLSNWDNLWVYLEDGSLPSSNMAAEHIMNKVCQVRRNALFFKNSETAKINCYLMSIVQTAIKNKVDVYRYLNYVIHHIGKVDIDCLLPWNENLYSLGEDYQI